MAESKKYFSRQGDFHRASLPRFLRLPKKSGIKIFPPRYDNFFYVRQLLLFIFRGCISFFNGGLECLVCGSSCFAFPVCKKCTPFYEVNFGGTPSLSRMLRCNICGKVLVSEKNICMRCRGQKFFDYIDFVFPLYSYELWNKKMLFDWKMSGNRSLSAFFASRMKNALFYFGQRVIVPVPPRPGKLKKNGWDQIEELSVFFEHSGFKVCRILERISKTEQKKLDREGRFASGCGAYRLKNGKSLERVLKKNDGKMPEEVCLVDDVITTGATLNSCAKVLKMSGVKKVSALTLFCVD